jgi:hypothetical protein
MKNALALPDNVINLLASADKRSGLPAGTMLAVFGQEAGGQGMRFINNPAEYHYPLNAQGKRWAAHSNVESSAFGPFGILESTGAKPGYGVAPLKDKSLEEQVRFASDYLAARVKAAGSFEAGLAGYGEGPKYARGVMARMGQRPTVTKAAPMPVAVAPPQEAPVSANAQANAAPVASVAPAEPPQYPGFTPTPEYLKALSPETPKLTLPTQEAPPVYAGQNQPAPQEMPFAWQRFVENLPMQTAPEANFKNWLAAPGAMPAKAPAFDTAGFAPFGGWKARA